ncbi:MAG: DUF1616 domain-containing protein [Solirubrobacteraceae bacterium]
MVRPRTDLALAMALALAALVFAAVLPSSLALLRTLLCLPLVLALPGYVLASALFRSHDLRGAEIATLSVAFSIAATILAGLLLDLLGISLTTAPWMGLLAVLTLAGAAWGSARGLARPIAMPRLRIRRADGAAAAVAVALLAGAAVLGFTPLRAPTGTQETSALWLVPAPNGRSAACVGVINEQLHVTSYEVSVLVAGRPARRFGPITLAPGAGWSTVIAVASGRPAIDASLSTTADPAVTYRSVALRDWNISAVRC